jgi:ribosomal-protein-alanine N-acetyltransferase
MTEDAVIQLALPQLETERLILRRMTMADAPDMFEYGSDPDVTRYVSWPTHKTVEDSERFLARVVNSYETTNPSGWGIVLKQSGKFIGTIGMDGSWKMKNFRLELGYVLNKDYWGQGLGTEAARAVISCLFDRTSVNRIQAHCLAVNIASSRLMENCGMKFEGLLRQFLFYKGKFEDVKIFSILRSEYLVRYSR